MPLVVAGSALAASVVFAVVALNFSAPIVVLGVTVLLVTPTAFWLSLVGYILTPMVVIACYGWDSISQRNGLRANRNFVLKPVWSSILLWVIVASLLIGAWHILNLSIPISEWLGLA